MSIYTEITNLESILANCTNDHSCEELASMEEELFRLEHIEDLWLEFGDIPMNPCLEIIEQPWHGFPAGTHRETIWHWFEDEFEISVAEDLMYPDSEPEKANPHFEAFIREEIERKGITANEKNTQFVLMKVTSDENLMSLLYHTIDDAIDEIKNSNCEYAVEIREKDTDRFVSQIDTYPTYDAAHDAIEKINIDCGYYFDIRKITYNNDGNEIGCLSV